VKLGKAKPWRVSEKVNPDEDRGRPRIGRSGPARPSGPTTAAAPPTGSRTRNERLRPRGGEDLPRIVGAGRHVGQGDPGAAVPGAAVIVRTPDDRRDRIRFFGKGFESSEDAVPVRADQRRRVGVPMDSVEPRFEFFFKRLFARVRRLRGEWLPRFDLGPGPAAVDGAVQRWARMTAGEPAAARRFEGDLAGLRRRLGQFPPVAAGVVADEERAEVAGGVALHLHQREELVAVDQREGDVGRGYAHRVGPQPRVAPGPAAVGRPIHGRPHVAFPAWFVERPAAALAGEVDAVDQR
jgi:hypothetical protein